MEAKKMAIYGGAAAVVGLALLKVFGGTRRSSAARTILDYENAILVPLHEIPSESIIPATPTPASETREARVQRLVDALASQVPQDRRTCSRADTTRAYVQTYGAVEAELIRQHGTWDGVPVTWRRQLEDLDAAASVLLARATGDLERSAVLEAALHEMTALLATLLGQPIRYRSTCTSQDVVVQPRATTATASLAGGNCPACNLHGLRDGLTKIQPHEYSESGKAVGALGDPVMLIL